MAKKEHKTVHSKKFSMNDVNNALTEEEKMSHLLRMVSVVNDSNDAIILQDFEGKILAWNRGAHVIYGYTEAEALEMNISNLVAESDREAALILTNKIKQGEVIKSFELKRTTKDGRILDVWLTITLLNNEKGKPIGIATTERDISDRKQAEKDLQLSELKCRNQANLFDVVAEGSPFAMWVSDAKGIMIRANQALRDILNLTDDMIVGKYNVLLDENLDAQGFMPVVKAVFNDLKSARFVMFWTGTKAGEVDLHLANELWIDVSMFPITDEAGKLLNVVCQYVDITEHKQAENKLRETDARHAAMIENIGDVIAILGADGMTKYQSPNIEKWFGWKPEDLIGTNGWDKMHPEDIERVQKEFSKMLEQDNASTVEYRFKCKDGIYKWIESTAVNRINEPSINGVLINYHDINERKCAEVELKKYRENLEEMVKERTLKLEEKNKELEKFNDLFVGREFRIKELKEKVKELETKITK